LSREEVDNELDHDLLLLGIALSNQQRQGNEGIVVDLSITIGGGEKVVLLETK